MKPGEVVFSGKTKHDKTFLIRYVTKDDLNSLLIYANRLSKENTFVLLSGEKVSREEESKYLNESLEKLAKKEIIHLVAIVDDKFAGNATVTRYKRRQVHAGDVAISIDQDFRDSGIGTIYLQTLISEANKLGLKLLTIDCMANNSRALHIYEKIGFIKIGTIPGMNKYNDSFIGLVKMYLPLN